MNHIRLVYRTEYRNSFFIGGGGGGRLLQILSLRRGANSKRGAYLKLGANSSIYGNMVEFTLGQVTFTKLKCIPTVIQFSNSTPHVIEQHVIKTCGTVVLPPWREKRGQFSRPRMNATTL